MKNDSPATAKLKMMKASMRCLMYGLFGLLPVIGLPFALAALWVSGRLRSQEKKLWNAAKPYRLAGAICAALGSIGWFLLFALLVLHAINHPSS
jgi:hypothetical protein